MAAHSLSQQDLEAIAEDTFNELFNKREHGVNFPPRNDIAKQLTSGWGINIIDAYKALKHMENTNQHYLKSKGYHFLAE